MIRSLSCGSLSPSGNAGGRCLPLQTRGKCDGAISRSSGNFLREVTWTNGGGGLSAYFTRPGYQNAVQSVVGRKRGVPDVSLVANPASDVPVYNSLGGSEWPAGWTIVGGTSLSSPLAAAIVNNAGKFATSSNAEPTNLYANLAAMATYAANFNDVTIGTCGSSASYLATAKWDKCTGPGTFRGLGGK